MNAVQVIYSAMKSLTHVKLTKFDFNQVDFALVLATQRQFGPAAVHDLPSDHDKK